MRASCGRVSLTSARRMTGDASVSALTTVTSSTPSGNRRVIRATASRTSFAAISRSTPGPNSARIRALFSSLAELSVVTPATRATAPSITLVTSASMVSGEAPSKNARTITTGRSTSGSSRTSMPNSAASPAITIIRFITTISVGRRIDSSGRSLKRPLNSFYLWPPLWPPGRRHSLHWRTVWGSAAGRRATPARPGRRRHRPRPACHRPECARHRGAPA